MSMWSVLFGDFTAMWSGISAFIPRFIAGILVFATFYVIYQGTVLVLRAALERKRVHASIINLTVKTYKYVLVVVGAVMALNQMGVNIGAALTGLGIIGVGLGFASQDTLKNYIAGITIFWDKPFHVGDYIEVQNQYGRVTEITMRSTRIRTLQNQYFIVPNQQIVDAMVINHSKNGEVRVEIPLSISYVDSISQARAALLALIDPERDPRISQYLRPTVVVSQLGDNGVNLLLRVWINKAEDEVAVRHDYLEKAKLTIEQHHMTIPFPQRVLHVREDGASHDAHAYHHELWHEKQKIPHLENSH